MSNLRRTDLLLHHQTTSGEARKAPDTVRELRWSDLEHRDLLHSNFQTVRTEYTFSLL